MNIFFVIDGKVVTPELNGSILPGITRKTVLELARELGYETEEKRLSIDDIINAHHDGRLTEIFGTGTAAVISPVGFLKYEEAEITINNNEIGPVTQTLFDEYTAIQTGKKEDKHGWRVVVGQESHIEIV
jgi:branched-chain amino acid aminotransferase